MPSPRAISSLAMFALSTAFNMTFGLLAVFVVGIPVLVNVLLGFIAIQVMAEHEDNLDYKRHHPPA